MPPTVVKEKVTPTSPTPNGPIRAISILDRIGPIKDNIEGGLKVVLYGDGKTGKTRLACTFPTPLLLIQTQEGTKSIKLAPKQDKVLLFNADELDILTKKYRVEGTEFKTIILDTAGGLQDFILRDILGLQDSPNYKTWGMVSDGQKTWGAIGMQLIDKLAPLYLLADERNVNVVIIAHERPFGDREKEGGKIVNPKIGPALTPLAATWLNREADYIGQTFIREQMRTESVPVEGGEPLTSSVPTGKKEYCLRVGNDVLFQTGFRVRPGTVLPDSVTDPTYAKIMKVIRGDKVT